MRKYRIVSIIILLCFLCACAGCAVGTKSKVITGYEATGMTLAEIKNSAENLCLKGTLMPEDCKYIKELYTKARASYIVAGDMLILSLETEDAIIKQKSFEAYQKALNEASELLVELLDLALKLGIKIR